VPTFSSNTISDGGTVGSGRIGGSPLRRRYQHLRSFFRYPGESARFTANHPARRTLQPCQNVENSSAFVGGRPHRSWRQVCRRSRRTPRRVRSHVLRRAADRVQCRLHIPGSAQRSRVGASPGRGHTDRIGHRREVSATGDRRDACIRQAGAADRSGTAAGELPVHGEPVRDAVALPLRHRRAGLRGVAGVGRANHDHRLGARGGAAGLLGEHRAVPGVHPAERVSVARRADRCPRRGRIWRRTPI
jgi:hypothetical protein